MFISILGRQPALSIAELERVFGGKNINVLSPIAATINTDSFDIQKFGGTLKAGKIVAELPGNDWYKINQKIISQFIDEWSSSTGKITLGISVYGSRVSTRDIQKTGLILKRKLKEQDVSLRLVPNSQPSLNTATSHHNKLGLSPNKVEIIVVSTPKVIYIASSTGAQNITAYANRDQKRPKRDAFVGMLPPKLAQIMVNLACGTLPPTIYHLPPTILDPFCGTGVILQEAALIGYDVYGTDLSDKMVDYSRINLEWLHDRHRVDFKLKLDQGDAMTTRWKKPIDAVVSETYLGQPFSAPPSHVKLEEVVGNCNHIATEFLKNISSQIEPGTLLCIAVPAWRGKDGRTTHLPFIEKIARLGYKPHEFTNISQKDLLYFREDQVVARELLVLVKA
jgi:tRNA G10  N-methylase Trm11